MAHRVACRRVGQHLHGDRQRRNRDCDSGRAPPSRARPAVASPSPGRELEDVLGRPCDRWWSDLPAQPGSGGRLERTCRVGSEAEDERADGGDRGAAGPLGEPGGLNPDVQPGRVGTAVAAGRPRRGPAAPTSASRMPSPVSTTIFGIVRLPTAATSRPSARAASSTTRRASGSPLGREVEHLLVAHRAAQRGRRARGDPADGQHRFRAAGVALRAQRSGGIQRVVAEQADPRRRAGRRPRRSPRGRTRRPRRR